MCDAQGIRQTPILRPGKAVTIYGDVPKRSAVSGPTSFAWAACATSTQSESCQQRIGIAEARLLTAEATTEIERAQTQEQDADPSSSTRSGAARESSGATGTSLYMTIAGEDRSLYDAYANSEQAAREVVEHESGRRVLNVLKCGTGWVAEWRIEDFQRKAASAGIACGGHSREVVLVKALEECSREFGGSCARSELGRVSVSSWKVRRKDLDAQTGTDGADSCVVTDGHAQ